MNILTEEPSVCDANCLLIKLNCNTCVIGIYRPPGKQCTLDFVLSLDKLLNTLNSFQNIFLMGDINIDIAPDTLDKRSFEYLNMMASHCLLPDHTIPTHGRTCLDHIMIKTKLRAACYIVESSITDHECTILNLNLQSPQLLNTFDKIRKHVDYINLDIAMNNLDLNCIYNIGDPLTNHYVEYWRKTLG